jgi:hypothetical protein
VSCAAPKCIWNLWLLNTLNSHTHTHTPVMSNER